jgi:hypothetical protein
LEFTVSYVVDYTKRIAMQDRFFTKIVEEIANSNGRLQWASPPGIPVSHPGTPGALEEHTSSSTNGEGHAADSR